MGAPKGAPDRGHQATNGLPPGSIAATLKERNVA